jgi:3-oxoacyl-[acyl-carrier protein] reductase
MNVENMLRTFSLQDRTAVVTGGGSGLGRRIGRALACFGAEVYFADLDEERARQSAGEAAACGDKARSLYIDVSDPISVQRAFEEVAGQSGKTDILVCSAGISAARWIEEMELKHWNRVLNVNLTGTFLCCQAAARQMIANRWGRIINIASIAALHAPRPRRFDGGYNYSASKAGVLGLSKRLAVELAPYHITVNCVSPGIMQTPLTEKAVSDETTYKQVIDAVPLGRLGSPQDLDGLLVYLSSQSSSFLTGQDIIIDGGYSVW